MSESETRFVFSEEAAQVLMAHLREAREEKGWTIEDLSDRTRMSLHVLQALEAGDFQVVEPPFVRAFLRSYAEEVGVQVDEVHGVFPEPKALVEVPLEDDHDIPIVPRPKVPWGTVTKIGGAVAFLTLLWLWQPWASDSETPAGRETPASDRTTPAQDKPFAIMADTESEADSLMVSTETPDTTAATENEPVLRRRTPPPPTLTREDRSAPALTPTLHSVGTVELSGPRYLLGPAHAAQRRCSLRRNDAAGQHARVGGPQDDADQSRASLGPCAWRSTATRWRCPTAGAITPRSSSRRAHRQRRVGGPHGAAGGRALPLPLSDPFTYHVPDEFEDAVEPGMRAVVPFRRDVLTGVVVGVFDEGSRRLDFDTKPIHDLPDPDPVFDDTMLSLTKWVAEYYLSTWARRWLLRFHRGSNVKAAGWFARRPATR